MKSPKNLSYHAYAALITAFLMFTNIGNATAEEKLCIEVTVEHSAGIFEEEGHDEHECQGEKITHIEFQTKKTGRAGAQLEEPQLPDVSVQWYAKAFSRVSYTLKVWVEE